MKNKPLSLLLIFSISFAPLFAQNFLKEYGEPLIPDSIPRVFAPGKISVPNSEEEGIAFSPDGSEIFFTRNTADEEGEKISSLLYLKRQGETWSDPRRPAFASKANESEAAFSEEGKSLFYFSERRKPGITPYIGEIWKVSRSENRWGSPRYHENTLNAAWINSISLTESGRLYFSSYRDKKMGIYYSDKINGEYQDPVYLPDAINSVAGATRPFISADESMLLFEGQTLGYGNTELYISFRTDDGIWTPAQKLNSNVNKTKTETNPSFSPDGKYLFFTREGDIYWVRIEYIF
jgi:Tol biopolymer transport system component